jgi:hypothetical protein
LFFRFHQYCYAPFCRIEALEAVKAHQSSNLPIRSHADPRDPYQWCSTSLCSKIVPRRRTLCCISSHSLILCSLCLLVSALRRPIPSRSARGDGQAMEIRSAPHRTGHRYVAQMSYVSTKDCPQLFARQCVRVYCRKNRCLFPRYPGSVELAEVQIET